MTRDAREIMIEQALSERAGRDVEQGEAGTSDDSLATFVLSSGRFVRPAFYVATFATATLSALDGYGIGYLSGTGPACAIVGFAIGSIVGGLFYRVLFGAMGALILSAREDS